MMAPAHTAVGVLTSLAIAKSLHIDLDVVTTNQALLLGAIGGLLPDIDHANSKLGRRIPLLPHLLTHRGITHTVYFIAVCGFLFSMLSLPAWMLYCFCGSITSHIVGDMLTPAGIKPFKILHYFEYSFCIPLLKIPMVEKFIEIGCYYIIVTLLR